MLSPDTLVDHPANPPGRVSPPAVAELMESIEQFGQREPVRVRVMDAETCQILSGHRRVAACRILGIDVRCEVVVCDDDEALREVMLGNAQRQDLDPIERGELLQHMIDQGIDRDEAGALFGLLSESGIKNALRIVQLPDSIKQLLRDGTIPARSARYLVPYAAVPAALDQFAKDLTSEYDETLAEFLRRPKETAETIVRTDGRTSDNYMPATARPVNGAKYRPAGYEYEDATCQFELTEDIAKKLDIVEVPIDGKPTRVATNVKLFDELNEPHLVKRSGYGGPPKSSKKTKAKKLTAAQQKAEEARKKKEAAERLKKGLAVFATRFRRAVLAYDTPGGHDVIAATLPWLVLAADSGWIAGALQTIDGRNAEVGWDMTRDKLGRVMADNPQGVVADRIWRVLVWPQRQADWMASKRVSDDPPAEMILNPKLRSDVKTWAVMQEATGVSIEEAWSRPSSPASPVYELVVEYLKLHNAEQLTKLAKSAKVETTETAKGKLVDVLAKHHLVSGLPLPKCLQGRRKKT